MHFRLDLSQTSTRFQSRQIALLRSSTGCRNTFRKAPTVLPRHILSCRSVVKAAATQEVEPGKFISSTPIPAFIPREDLIQQLFGWARIEADDAGTSYGLPMKARPVHREEGQLWGFIVSFYNRDGAVTTEVRVRFDEEEVTKHQWVGRGADGFPSLEGNEETVLGNELIIRKIDDNPIDDETRSAIRSFCVKLVESVNKYYAFGSCFVDDNT